MLWPDNVYVNSLRPNDICVGNPTIIGSDNGLSPARCQAIIWTNAGIFVGWTFESTLQWSFDQNSNIFTQESAFEGVVCVMAAILSLPQGVNMASALRFRFTDTGATICLPGACTVCNYGIRYTCIYSRGSLGRGARRGASFAGAVQCYNFAGGVVVVATFRSRWDRVILTNICEYCWIVKDIDIGRYWLTLM